MTRYPYILKNRGSYRSARHSGGAVALEFIVLIPVVFLFILGVFQVIHGFITREALEYATYRGARAAAVWLQEVDTESGASADAKAAIEAAVALAMTPVSPSVARATGRGSPATAYMRVATAVGGQGGESYQAFKSWSAHGAFDASIDVKRRGKAKAAYAFHAIKVNATRDYGGNRVKVDVEYAFYCAWPLANIFYGKALGEVGGGWSGRLSQGGVTPKARVRIMKSSASHFLSNKPS